MKTIFWLLLLPLLFMSCEEKEQAITKEEAIAFAQKLEASIEKGHPQLFDSAFKNKVFIKRIANEIGEDANPGYLQGVKEALREKNLGREILKNMSAGDTYEFLNHYEKNQRHHVIFRMYGTSGINYHDFELVKINDRIGLADIYIYMTGENISKTFGRTISLVAEVADRETEDSMMVAVKNLQEIRSLMNRRQFEKASVLFEELPEALKKDKAIQIMNLSIASELDLDKYKEVLSAFEKQYGNDPAAQLSLFDSYFLNKQYEKAIHALNMVDSSVNKDPIMHFYRALVYTQMEDQANTIKSLELLYKEKPDFGDGVLELIANYIEAEENAKAEKLLAVYKNNKAFDQAKLENLKYLYPYFTALNGTK